MSQVFNPFLPLYEYIPDGEPHIFGNRVYLFGSHDKEGGETFCMLDYVVYSAPVNDLKNWRCEGTIYRAKQDADYSEERPYMYAPDVVQGNDGRFYLYYCLSGKFGKGGYAGHISVAVCDTPAGQYQYLGFVKNPDGSPMKTYVCFDPAVLNDNGTIRLYYGTQYPYEEEPDFRNRPELIQQEADMFGKSIDEILNTSESVMGASMCVLGEDMMTVAELPKHIVPYAVKHTSFEEHPFFEAPSMRKVGQKYYFIYSSWQNHELCYAVSDYPDKNFTYKGTIISNGDIGYHGRKPENRLNMTGTTHGSIIQIQNQWYVFYHRLTHKSDYSRQACAEPIVILPDGTIPQTEMTSCGLNGTPLSANAVYPAVIACNITNGHMPHGSNRIYTDHFPNVTHKNQERFIAEISDNTLIGYKYFKFHGGERLRICYQSTGNGIFYVYDNPNGQPVGELPVTACENWQNVQTQLQIQKGIYALYLRYAGQGEVSLLEFELIPEKQETELNQKSSFFTAMAVVAAAMLFLAGASFTGKLLNQNSETELLETTTSAITSTTTDIATSTTVSSSSMDTSYQVYDSSREYQVGKNIPAGLYLAIVENYENYTYDYDYGDFYIEIFDDSGNELFADWVQCSHYLELSDGQSLSFSHAKLYPVENFEYELSAFIYSGMYQVGKDIPAGSYEIIANKEYSGSYIIYDSAKPDANKITEYNYLESGKTNRVILEDGQFLDMKFCKINQALSEISETSVASAECYPEGEYLVGEDIPAGLYFAKASNASETNGMFQLDVYESDNISKGAIIGGWSQNYRYVALENGQLLKLGNAVLYSAELAPQAKPYELSGMYQIGKDIPEGIYTIMPNTSSSAIIIIYDSAGKDAAIISAKNIHSNSEVIEVHNGEFLEMRNCCLKK